MNIVSGSSITGEYVKYSFPGSDVVSLMMIIIYGIS